MPSTAPAEVRGHYKRILLWITGERPRPDRRREHAHTQAFLHPPPFTGLFPHLWTAVWESDEIPVNHRFQRCAAACAAGVVPALGAGLHSPFACPSTPPPTPAGKPSPNASPRC